MRRVLIGTTVAIFGIAAALGVGYPAGAKSARSHHAQCAKAANSRAKKVKRGAKCKKRRKSAKVRSAPATKPSAANKPTAQTTTPTATRPATRGSGSTPWMPSRTRRRGRAGTSRGAPAARRSG